MPTLLDLTAQMVGEVPGLSRLFAAKYINNALLEIRRDRLWSWNVGEGILITPASVGAGTVTATFGSPLVQFDATAQAILLPLVLANPPLTERQLRIGGTSPIYSIIAYNSGTGVATLERLYGETTVSGVPWTIYKCYYGPPTTDGVTPNNDFLRYLSINNTIQGYSIYGKRLYMTRTELNRRDPLRGALGFPYYMASFIPTPNPSPPNNVTGTAYNIATYGQMLYEPWPHPVFQMSLQCNYERLHVDLQPNDVIPAQCPATLITYKATEYAYRWAIQNSGRIPELKGVPWMALLQEIKLRYLQALVAAKRNDNEIMPKVLHPGAVGMYELALPIDSNLFQSHGVPML